MDAKSDKVKQVEGLLGLGLSLTEAVAKAIGAPLAQLAERHGFRHTEVSMCLLGYHQRVYPEIRDVVCAELETDRPTLDDLIERQRAAKGAA